ncbi:MAG: hypothetical protein QOJ52_1539 [Acidimicrobiaceae bacterium]|nr:hypothetical protein [Acidimicrobiaceae bacterium]
MAMTSCSGRWRQPLNRLPSRANRSKAKLRLGEGDVESRLGWPAVLPLLGVAEIHELPDRIVVVCLDQLRAAMP